MSKNYDCELCGKHFPQKCDYDKHKNKKTPCVSMEKMEELLKKKSDSSDNKVSLTNLFKSCLDILRDGHDIMTGDKALRNFAYLLDLKLLEPQIGKEIKFDEFDYDFDDMDDSVIEQNKKKLLKCVKFSNLAKEEEGNYVTILNSLWKYILSQHPKTKNIFVKNKNFDITHQSTFKKLIKKLNDYDFTKVDSDVLGDAYSVIVAENMQGDLGQFFTPHKVTKMMVNLVDPKIQKDGKIETIFDPAMGTGGFLISSIRHMIEQSKLQKINLDWDFISKGAICGREADQDTYQLAVSNMLISSGHMFNKLEKGDSIRDPIKKKYDVVLANPPFGIKGLTYDEIEDKLRDDYMPIKINSAVPLFLQAIIYMLNINGRCAVVIPDGQELSSNQNTLVTLREYLMKTCDLKEVISMPAGIFTDTTIRTCILFFTKKKECGDVLKTEIKYTKGSGKESKREYKFSKSHQTNKVKFYDYNPETNSKYLLVEVDIEELEKNNYLLKYNDYIKDNDDNEKYDKNIIIKEMKEVCIFKNGKGIKKDKLIEGEYPVIGGGKQPLGYHNEFNTEENTILCSSSGAYAGYISKYDKKVWASDCFSIKPKKEVDNEYLYYLLKCVYQKKIYKLQSGTAQPHVYSKNLEKIKIPVPSMEKQKEIVNNMKKKEEEINNLKNKIKIIENETDDYINNVMKKKEDKVIEKKIKKVKKEDKKKKIVVEESSESDSDSESEIEIKPNKKEKSKKKVVKKEESDSESESSSESELSSDSNTSKKNKKSYKKKK